MIRKGFSNHLRGLEQQITGMGRMVTDAIERSVDALRTKNMDLARQVITDDAPINRLRWEIEDLCIHLIATQQPVASDLREIISALTIVTDLERIGDYAEGIAKITVLHGDEPLVRPLCGIPIMAKKAVNMLQRSIEAFLKRDIQLASQVCNDDDEVDRLYDQVYRDLLTYMIEDPKTITRATYLIWAAHNVERIADRATNICERTVYLATGRMPQVNVSTY